MRRFRSDRSDGGRKDPRLGRRRADLASLRDAAAANPKGQGSVWPCRAERRAGRGQSEALSRSLVSERSGSPVYAPADLKELFDAYRKNALSLGEYKPERIPTSLTFFKPKTGAMRHSLVDQLSEGIVGDRTVFVEGDHYSMLDNPGVGLVAAHILMVMKKCAGSESMTERRR